MSRENRSEFADCIADARDELLRMHRMWMMMTEEGSDHARLALEGAFFDEVKYTSRN